MGKGEVEGYRENTLDGFLAAVERGLRWVEVDVRRTADDELGVLHNPTTEEGAFLIDQPFAAASAHGLLRLADLLAALPPHVGVDFDVKSSLEDALLPRQRTTAALLAPLLEREAARRPVLVTSFDPSALLMIRAAVPQVALGLMAWLYFPLRKAIPAAAHLDMQVVAAHWRSFAVNRIDPAPIHREAAYSVRIAHEAGLEVLAWSPPPKHARRLVDAGVDAVVVNDLAGTRRALAGLPGEA